MALPVGIDLGTTNSVISVYRRGRTEALRVDGDLMLPSAVCFRDANTTLVGNKALNMAMIRPEKTILHVKRKMGLRNEKYSIDGKEYTPVDISTLILQKLCEYQEEALGGPPTDAVITVPAYFTDEQRKDTKLAGEKAGLNVLRLLPEPTAAAISIGLDKGRDQTLLIYDLGGGTFDVSILEIHNNDFTVKAVNGDHDLGGNDFDVAICDYSLEFFKKEKGIDLGKEDPSSAEVRQAHQVLTSACERVKMELSEAEEAYLDLPNFYRGEHLELSIDRRTFESLIKNLIYKTKDLVLQTISEAKLDVDDIDRLVLVGGSTKIPMVGRILGDTVREPYVADNVDLAVSSGAAIAAANLHSIADKPDGTTSDYAPVELNITDVVAHAISVALGDEAGRLKCIHLIEKNSPLPTSGMTLGAAMPGQRLGQVPVYRGPSEFPSENEYLGLLTLTLDPNPQPTPVRFEVYLDESGVLQVEGAIVDPEGRDLIELVYIPAKDLKVKRRVQATIKLPD